MSKFPLVVNFRSTSAISATVVSVFSFGNKYLPFEDSTINTTSDPESKFLTSSIAHFKKVDPGVLKFCSHRVITVQIVPSSPFSLFSL